MPPTDSDSCTIEEITANWRCRFAVIRRRSVPTRRLTHANTGSIASDASARCQSSAIMAMMVADTVVRLDTSAVAVVVTVACIPPMSLAIRDCTSPVGVLVKNSSDICCPVSCRRWPASISRCVTPRPKPEWRSAATGTTSFRCPPGSM